MSAVWGAEVCAAAHFEAILREWCSHCFEDLHRTEAGMLAVHLREVATLSSRLAAEAEHACGGRSMLPCPMYDEGVCPASPAKLCEELRRELRRRALGEADVSPSLDIPTGVPTFGMARDDDSFDEGDGLDPSSDRALLCEENARLRESLDEAERRVAELGDAESMTRFELHSTHRIAAELADEKCRLSEQATELQRQVDQLCQAGESLCPACDRRFVAPMEEHLEAPDAGEPIAAVSSCEPPSAPKDHSIAAVVRLKPHPRQGVPVWTAQEGRPDSVVDGRTGQDLHFDRVFGPEASTVQVFEACAEELVQSFCQGINATVMAYGQTASGKTYTMEGGGGGGIIQLAVEAVFSYFGDLARSGMSYTIRGSYLEIHNEKLLDLLAESGPTEVRLLDSSSGAVQTSPPLTRFDITEPGDVARSLEVARRHRHVGKTGMNDQSSRSHVVLQLQLESRRPSDGFMRKSLLNLVDLAGSECAKYTGAVGERLIEARNINRSLLALCQVVAVMSDNANTGLRPSFRDSKLTRIVQQSIGGNSRTALICTVSSVDWHYHESRRTLEFALRAKSIRNHVSPNLVKVSASRPPSARASPEVRALLGQNGQLQLQVAQLRAQLAEQAPGGKENGQSLPQKRPLPRRQSLADVTNMREASVEKRHQRRKSTM